MPRKPRVHYNGALFHVICRGNNRDWILSTDDDKRRYLELLTHYKQRYDFKLYAWVIMSNHIHMLIETGDVPLSKIMQGLQQSYTQWYNRKNDRKGHVFEQRYKALQCNKDSYLLNLMRYIHQNPVRIGMEEGLAYPWSGHLAYSKGIRTDITDVLFPLSLFSDQRDKARAQYIHFLAEEEDIFETLTVLDIEEGTRDVVEHKAKERVCIDVLEQIVLNAAHIVQISVEELLSPTRHQNAARCRHVVIDFCQRYTAFSQKEVASGLKITESAVSKALRNTEDNKEVLKELENVSTFQA